MRSMLWKDLADKILQLTPEQQSQSIRFFSIDEGWSGLNFYNLKSAKSETGDNCGKSIPIGTVYLSSVNPDDVDNSSTDDWKFIVDEDED